MATKTHTESIEFRKYELNSAFPVLVLNPLNFANTN